MNHSSKIKRIAVLIIGNEILCGEVEEANAAFLAGEITRLGSSVERIITVPDNEGIIAEELSRLAKQYDAVLVTGGIGATHDDRTRQAVANAFGKKLAIHGTALDSIENHFKAGMNPGRRALAELPEGSRLIPNTIGWAPGFILENVYVFPGVPSMVKEMFPSVSDDFAGPVLHVRKIFTDIPESIFAVSLSEIAAASPTVSIGSYPLSPAYEHRVRLVIKSRDRNALEHTVKTITEMLTRLES